MSEVIKSSEKSNSGPTVIVNQQEKESNEEIRSSEKSNSGQTTVIVNQQERKSNGLGTAGFILAIIALFFGWVPAAGWIVWTLGFIFSFIGVFKTPRGMAIAGLAISLIGIILLITVSAAIAALIFGDAGLFSELF